MASGLLGRGRDPGSKSFDFGSDDILCSYEEFSNQDGNNGNHSDPSFLPNSTKEFHKNRVARPSGFSTTYSPPEESSYNQDVLSTVDKTMKKHSDNIMRFLEGISSRMSQLELYCYNLDKSIGEMHSELVRDHGEAETKLKFLEKHVQEVHRSVQIIRDKQELAETQTELAKLHLVQKESSSASSSQQEDRSSQPAIDAKKSDHSSDAHCQQLALALPHQVAPQPLPPTQPVEHQQAPTMAPPPPLASHSVAQAQSYYLPPSQVQYLPSQTQIQDLSRMAPQQTQSNQSPQVQSLPQYQQQWTQQPLQQVQQPQMLHMQPQIRSSSPALYPSYPPNQPNPSPAEMTPNSMPMQVSYSVSSQLGSTGTEAMSYGYGDVGRPSQPQRPAQHLKTAYNAESSDGYVPSGPRSSLPSGNAYMTFDGEGGRTHHATPQSHFQQNAYPPTSVPLQNPHPQHMGGSNMMIRPPQLMRSHPYNELIEKLAGMGYRADHVVGVIQRMEESGQPIDFNALLDRLNGHSSGGSQRGWSG